MKKSRLITLLLILSMVCALVPVPARASELVDSGSCGENLTWVLTSDGTLTISGTGEMESYFIDPAGWFAHRDILTKVVIEEGVTSVSNMAFGDCGQLRWVYLPSTLTEIGNGAFQYCQGLELVVFTGNAPKIQFDAFKATDAMAVYPAGDDTWNLVTLDQLSYGDISWVNGETPVSLRLQRLPYCTNVALNESLDLRGIQVWAAFEDRTEALLKSGVMQVDSCDTSSVGMHTATVSYQGLTVTFPVYVHAGRSEVELDPATLPESEHSYQNNAVDRQTVSYPGADFLTLTFSEETDLSHGDYLVLFTADGKEYTYFAYDSAAGRTIRVPGDTVVISLEADDDDWEDYGYKVVSARAEMVDHTWEQTQGQAPGCETDGWAPGSRCTICGKMKDGEVLPATGHSYGAWYKGEDGVLRSDCAVCGHVRTSDADYYLTEGGKASLPQLSLEETKELAKTVDWNMNPEYETEPVFEEPQVIGRLTDACIDNLTAEFNFFRRLVRLDPVVWTEELVQKAQAAAFGVEGAGRDAFVSGGCMDIMTHIPLFLNDAYNTGVIWYLNERQQLLAPNLQKIGFGYADDIAASCLEKGSYSGEHINFVAWPGGNGVFPAEFMDSGTPWTITLNARIDEQATAENLRVLLTCLTDGRQWDLRYNINDRGWLGINMQRNPTIIFWLNDVRYYEGPYHLQVSGIKTRDGKEIVVEYSVDFQNVIHMHYPEVRNAVEASCTEDGYTGDTYCEDCGELMKPGEVIPAGHVYENYHCIRCGKLMETDEPIPPTSHVYHNNHCIYCGIELMIPGDANRDYVLTADDAIYLLYHVLFGNDLYPVGWSMDVNKDGRVDSDDAIYILYVTLFGEEQYPLI